VHKLIILVTWWQSICFCLYNSATGIPKYIWNKQITGSTAT